MFKTVENDTLIMSATIFQNDAAFQIFRIWMSAILDLPVYWNQCGRSRTEVFQTIEK